MERIFVRQKKTFITYIALLQERYRIMSFVYFRKNERSPPREGLIIDEQFGFRPAHSCPQQVLRLVEYVSEALKPNSSTVAVFFDVAKAFDRQTDISHLGMSALTRQDVLSEQEFLKAPPSPLLYSAYTNDVPRPSSSGVQLALFADDTALFYGNRNRSTDSPPPSRGPLTS
ncbi:hypothetical protein EVAR_80579_1 [Eumeta japonica]|uniref:RNA-directed DNA polymerase from transposon BS n=1 Tax=Eumeta variegata TaxID=151549 RepID=A0A4C1TME9_EUMVA|nr:hypothetical protein EVAR_80579_1 [Eumeta japonica]